MKIVSLVIALTATSSLFAQGLNDIRFNEILVKNGSNITNSLGERAGWIELTNIGYSTTDLGGCRLVKVTSSGEEVTHIIPKGLNTTALAPQNYALIHSGAEETSPLAVCFGLEDAVELRLYDSRGKYLLDKVVIDQNQVVENVSLGRPLVYRGSLKGRTTDSNVETRLFTLEKTASLTPNHSNFPAPLESRAEAFRRIDFTGLGMTVIAMSVVFLALLCLFGVFAQVGKIMQNIDKKREAKANPASQSNVATSVAPTQSLNGEALAAIGYAIKLYNDELNESEARVLTINRTVRAYSPWSSKIYGLTQTPNRK